MVGATPGDCLRLSRWRWETGGREGGRCGPEVVGATPGDGVKMSIDDAGGVYRVGPSLEGGRRAPSGQRGDTDSSFPDSSSTASSSPDSHSPDSNFSTSDPLAQLPDSSSLTQASLIRAPLT